MTEPQVDKIELYDHPRKLERELTLLDEDSAISEENKQTIRRFIHDARVGRTVKRGARRRLSAGRCRKLLSALRLLAAHIPCALEDVTPEMMEKFIIGLEEGQIHKRHAVGGSSTFAASSILDIKKVTRKFYRWLWPGEDLRLDELTGWFDMRDEAPELHTFGYEAVQRMAYAARGPQMRALIMLLFDSGARATEMVNLRLQDLTFRRDQGDEVCWIRIRVSKTRPRTIPLPLATRDIRFWVERHPQGGPIGEDGLVQAKDATARLITWSYHYCRKIVADLGRQELNQHVYLHRFRHASATWWAKRLSHYELTARLGWSMGSRAVQRYIDHSGVLAQSAVGKARDLPQQCGIRSREETLALLLGQVQSDPQLAQLLRVAMQQSPTTVEQPSLYR